MLMNNCWQSFLILFFFDCILFDEIRYLQILTEIKWHLLTKCNIVMAYLEILNTVLYWIQCYDVSTSKSSFKQFNAFAGNTVKQLLRAVAIII